MRFFGRAASQPARMSVHVNLVSRSTGRLSVARYCHRPGHLRQSSKGVATRDGFAALLEAVHRKLGSAKSSEKKGWSVNDNTSGSFVTLDCATIFTGGAATEQFAYHLQGKAALPAGHHINSNALIIK